MKIMLKTFGIYLLVLKTFIGNKLGLKVKHQLNIYS